MGRLWRCQKHTSFADNFIFFKLVTRKQTVDSCHKHISFADNFIFFKLVTRKQTEHEHQHQQLKTFMQTDYLPSRQYHLQSADSWCISRQYRKRCLAWKSRHFWYQLSKLCTLNFSFHNLSKISICLSGTFSLQHLLETLNTSLLFLKINNPCTQLKLLHSFNQIHNRHNW